VGDVIEGETTVAFVAIVEGTQMMLEELARLDSVPISAVLARAVETYWGRRINEASNEAYATLKVDPKAWQELQDERSEWDVTLADGLNDE